MIVWSFRNIIKCSLIQRILHTYDYMHWFRTRVGGGRAVIGQTPGKFNPLLINIIVCRTLSSPSLGKYSHSALDKTLKLAYSIGLNEFSTLISEKLVYLHTRREENMKAELISIQKSKHEIVQSVPCWFYLNYQFYFFYSSRFSVSKDTKLKLGMTHKIQYELYVKAPKVL